MKLGNGKMEFEEVLFVIGLRYSLLSVSKICDKGNDYIFKKYGCEIRRLKSGWIITIGTRIINNLYILIITSKGSHLLR